MSKQSLEVASDKLIRISYSAIVAIVIAVFGFGVWMTSMESKAQANSESIVDLKEQYGLSEQLLLNIDKRLARIETLLERNITKEK
jgi:flagellar basal body-associated protein FliL